MVEFRRATIVSSVKHLFFSKQKIMRAVQVYLVSKEIHNL